MSSSQKVLFLRNENGEQKWFENGNEDSDGKYIGEIKNGEPNGQGTYTYPDADFTEAKRSRQDAKNKCCILLFIGIRCTGNCPEFLSCFKLWERGVIMMLVITRTVT